MNNNFTDAVRGISFSSNATGAYTLNGTAITLGSSGIANNSTFDQTLAINLTLGANQSFTAATGNLSFTGDVMTDGFTLTSDGNRTTSFLGVISGNGSFVKAGNGTTILTGNNTYAGTTLIQTGTLQVGNGGTSGTLGTGAWITNSNLAFNRFDDLTLDKSISGTGSVTKLGSNTLTLRGSNTHSGGTIVNSGILSVAKYNALGTGDLTLNNGSLYLYSAQEMAGHVQVGGNFLWNNGTISYFDTGDSPESEDLKMVVAGNFTNGGAGGVFDFKGVEALNKGAYTLVTFNGTTNFAPSQLQAVAGATTTLIGNFEVSNGSVVYTLEDATSKSDAKAGYHIQNNGGPNTPVVANYIIDTATKTVNPVNKVKSLTFESDGSLDIEAGGRLYLSKGTLTVNNGASTITGGAMIAESDLNKDGIGKLDVKMDLVVAGKAIVNDGLLSINGQAIAGEFVVNPLGSLGGTGLIISNVRNTGVVAPGNSPGTLTISGNYEQASSGNLNIEIASTSSFDRLVVSGQMTAAGTLNVIPYGGMKLAFGQTYDIIEAGSITGAFDSIIVPANLRARFLNLGTIGLLVFAPDDFLNPDLKLNRNQKSIAKALNEFLTSNEEDQQAVVTALDLQTLDQYPASFDQISISFYESLANLSIEQAFNQTQFLNQRISSVRLGIAGFQAMGGISQPLANDRDGTNAAEARDAGLIDWSSICTGPAAESSPSKNWNAWALGTGTFSRTINLGTLQNYNNDVGGFLVGSDYRWNQNFVTGLYAGYDYTYSKYTGSSNMRGNGVNFGTYASYAKDGYYADAVIGGGYTAYQTKRSIQFSTIDRTANADPNSAQFTAGINLGKDFEIRKFTFGPIAGAQFTAVNIGSFKETGAESLDLSLAQQNASSLRSTLGGRIAYTWNLTQKITLIPEVRMFWQHEFMNNARTMSASLDAGSGSSFDYETPAPYRNSVFSGVGATAQFGENISGSIFYNINFGSATYQSNMISTGLNFSF